MEETTERLLVRKMVEMVGLQESILELLQDIALIPAQLAAKPEEQKKADSKARVAKGCERHPKYQAIRRPRQDCPSCLEIYEVKHGVR